MYIVYINNLLPPRSIVVIGDPGKSQQRTISASSVNLMIMQGSASKSSDDDDFYCNKPEENFGYSGSE